MTTFLKWLPDVTDTNVWRLVLLVMYGLPQLLFMAVFVNRKECQRLNRVPAKPRVDTQRTSYATRNQRLERRWRIWVDCGLLVKT